jgi:L-alanine-DL-glutamate epimerase-like enolase superfamily enzyme
MPVKTNSKTSTAIKMSFEPLNMKTAHPFGISYGTSSDTNNILVRLKWEGLEGLGEAAPAHYHSESVETVTAVLGHWQDSDILGNSPFAIQEVCWRLHRSVAGNNSAKAAIEMALQDLMGKALGKPLYQILGLDGLSLPFTDFTIGMDTLEVIEKKTRLAVEAGYKTLKVKQGTSFDRDIIKTVRKVAPNMPLRVDANGAWTPKRAIEMSHFLADNGVQFIEQPLPKFALAEDFRFVRERSPLPIFADESICVAGDVARLAGCIDGVVVKLAKTGGISEALRVIHTARAHGLSIMFGCMIESSVGVTAAAHLASLVDHLDLDGSLLLAHDPYCGVKFDRGELTLPELPGLGVVLRK